MAFSTAEIQKGSNPQTPTGSVDGTNKVFTAKPPLNNLFLNEGFQTPNVDYTAVEGGGEVTTTFVAPPPSGSVIFAT